MVLTIWLAFHLFTISREFPFIFYPYNHTYVCFTHVICLYITRWCSFSHSWKKKKEISTHEKTTSIIFIVERIDLRSRHKVFFLFFDWIDGESEWKEKTIELVCRIFDIDIWTKLQTLVHNKKKFSGGAPLKMITKEVFFWT